MALGASFSVREFRNDNAVTVSSGQNNMGTLTDNSKKANKGGERFWLNMSFQRY